MVGVEIDMVLKDSLEAIKAYENVFDLEVLEMTNFASGSNEVVFTLFGVRFHLLDENPDYQLFAPKAGENRSMWLNVMVEDIQNTFDKAVSNGFTAIQPVVKLEDFGVSNAVLSDPFGYVWMLHQMHHVVSFDERMEKFKEMGFE
ncbi:MAG: VOC family protein [Tissierellia bacterium]|nr:VOC family protein [Tissierellia bacterium]